MEPRVDLFKFENNSRWKVPDEETKLKVKYQERSGQRSGSAEVTFIDVGVDVKQETIGVTFEGENKRAALKGPSGKIDMGFKSTSSSSLAELAAYGELSVAKAEGEVNVTENLAVLGSANLNANTGVKLNKDGVKCNLLGFGLTLGVEGRWTFDTPLGSAGVSTPQTQANDRKNSQKRSQGLLTN